MPRAEARRCHRQEVCQLPNRLAFHTYSKTREPLTISIKVIQPTNTSINNILQTRTRQDLLAIAHDRERLLAHTHVHLERGRASRSIEGLCVSTRSNLHGGGGLQERDHEDRVFHGLPSVGTTLEVVAGVVARVGHAGVCGVTVCVLRRRSVPVDQLVFGDVFVH